MECVDFRRAVLILNQSCGFLVGYADFWEAVRILTKSCGF